MEPEIALATVSFRRVAILQRVEAALLFALNAFAYHQFFPHRWLIFWLLFFTPDIALLAYAGSAVSRKRAADLYNLLHSYAIPVTLLLVSWITGMALLMELSLIWTAHISFDRMAGYGLKLQEGFRFTHLGMVGKANTPA